MKKLRYLTYLVILLVFVLSTTAVLEAANVDEELDWPKRTITIVVPFGTGGDSDLTRVMAKYLSKELGVNVVVENISGSGGSIGSSAVKDAEPDGYTVLQNHNALMIPRAKRYL